MSVIAIVALAIGAYCLVAARLGRLSISGPMVLVVVGAIIGPAGAGVVDPPARSEGVQLLAELTLALVLFSDASTIGLREAGGIAWLPARLLAIGLPLTIAAGALGAYLVLPHLGLGMALLAGAMLAPTDAALGLPFITNPAIPVRIRRVVNIESGLNDGIATPFVTLALAIALAQEGVTATGWLTSAVLEIGIAVLCAIAVGGLGGRLVLVARERGWASPASESLAVVALAVLAYAGAAAVGGNGFVSAFGAGIAFRAAMPSQGRATELVEALALAASYAVWLVFGIGMAGPIVAAGLDASIVVYALLSLTIVRMAPVALSLVGSRLRQDTVALVGWFGPRGLASVVFLLVALGQLGPDHPATYTLAAVVTWTVLLSVFAHGLSASPLVSWYGSRIALADPAAPELEAAEEPLPRRRFPDPREWAGQAGRDR